MKLRNIVIACGCAAFVITGCGLKGPLYLPDKQESVPAGNKKDAAKKTDEKKNTQQTAPPAGTAADSSVK
jgi:predicted small lipoprotein YifL